MLKENYKNLYTSKKSIKLYPTEFIVRSFLGTYSKIRPIKNITKSKKVLDLGFGDGRNLTFLNDIGYEVYGVEISEEIIESCKSFLELNRVNANLRVGSNQKLSFNSKFFDSIVACHSCYYVEKGSSFKDNLSEISRVLKNGGRFVFSVPSDKSYLLKNSKKLPDNHVVITEDPYNIRNGAIIKFFKTKKEIYSDLSVYFKNIYIGKCENNWWGVKEYAWIVICEKK